MYPIMAIFIVGFILLMLWDVESRMNSRFKRSDQRFNRMAKTLLAIQEDVANVNSPNPQGGRQEEPEIVRSVAKSLIDSKAVRFSSERNDDEAVPADAKSSVVESVEDDSAKVPDYNRIARLIAPTTFSRGNNTNIFWRYADPKYVYRVLGKVDVTHLRELVKRIPESVWQEGAERAKKYKVHQYTATIALRFGGDRIRELKQQDNPFEGTLPTYDLLNQYGEMKNQRHWDDFKSGIEPILKYIQSKFDNKNGIWLRVLLVRLTAGKSVSIHRDNGLWMRMSHRIHVPVFTDEKVEFHASNKPKSYRGNAFKETDLILPVQQPGAVVELNNANIHYVRNSSPNDRVHMICDYMPEIPKHLTYLEWRCLLGDKDKCRD